MSTDHESPSPLTLEALHHVTMITGDAQRNVAFYAGLLGLRLVKKTVNFDQPEAYHLYFADEHGSPGSVLTWFEFPGAQPGRAGAGMIHRLELGVADSDALDFWADRLGRHDHPATRTGDRVRFRDYDGLEFDLVAAGDGGNPPLRADHPEIPAQHAILGIEGARAFTAEPAAPHPLLTDTLGFTAGGPGEYTLTGTERHVHWGYDAAPAAPGVQGAGTVHHIAWCSRDEDHLGWQARARDAGQFVTEVKDRDYFRAIYFREPRGVLFEIATTGPGFAVDEDADHLGEQLRVPAMHAHRREQLERTLTPVVNPRTTR